MNEDSRAYPFQFTGSGEAYFRIWIFDLVLSVLTLGGYSAWAKVRRKRYFHEHTWLNGHNFDYLADPVALLKGRLFVIGALLAAALALSSLSWFFLIPLGLLFLATPWLLLRSRQRDARDSSYRGLHFDFKGDLGEAYRIFLGWGALALLSLGVMLPYLLFRKTAFIVGNHAYGATPASFKGRGRSYYRIFLNAGLILFAPLVVIVAGGVILATILHEGPVRLADLLGILGLGLALLYAVVPVAAGYTRARIARLTFMGTRFGGLRFAGRHTARGLIRLYVVNLLLIVLTLGLYIPWARVRSARYWLDNLAVIGPARGLDGFVVAAAAGGRAMGAEITDTHALDLRLA
jgi:uncharacterized membrane protein YjgN (DUF898 family)